MIRLVAIDVDDTLINHKLEISPENLQAIQATQAKGVRVMLATGRMHISALPYAKQLALPPDEAILSYNGAMLRRINGELIAHIAVEYELAKAVIRYCQAENWTLNIYFEDKLYVEQMNDNVEYYIRNANVDAIVVGDLLEFIAENQKALSKLLIVGTEAEIAQRFPIVTERFGAIAQVTRSKSRYIELTHNQASKGITLANYAKSLGIASAQVLAIGDSGNDLTMLQYAGIGVAMGNGNRAVQEIADYVTRTNEESGVASALRRFVL